MTKLFSLIFSVCFIVSGFSQKKEAYKLYNSKGKKVSYKKMLKQLSKADVVFFGEEHNNPIAHWLELEVTIDLSKTRELILGAEMFETDNQQALSDYLSEKIDAKQFKDTARLWKNYKTDYKPLVEFAKKNNLKFIATNVPRKFASLVYHKGFKGLDTLSNAEKQWLPKLPIAFDATLPGYVKMLKMMEGHGGDNLPKSQALKDATMANSIATNYESGKLFIHYNGSYHSNDFEGILWYLKKQLPQLKVMTITMAEQSDISNLATKNKNKAHFIIIVPETMTKTY